MAFGKNIQFLKNSIITKDIIDNISVFCSKDNKAYNINLNQLSTNVNDYLTKKSQNYKKYLELSNNTTNLVNKKDSIIQNNLSNNQLLNDLYSNYRIKNINKNISNINSNIKNFNEKRDSFNIEIIKQQSINDKASQLLSSFNIISNDMPSASSETNNNSDSINLLTLSSVIQDLSTNFKTYNFDTYYNQITEDHKSLTSNITNKITNIEKQNNSLNDALVTLNNIPSINTETKNNISDYIIIQQYSLSGEINSDTELKIETITLDNILGLENNINNYDFLSNNYNIYYISTELLTELSSNDYIKYAITLPQYNDKKTLSFSELSIIIKNTYEQPDDSSDPSSDIETSVETYPFSIKYELSSKFIFLRNQF